MLPVGFLIGRFADWPIMIHIPWPRALTFQIVNPDLLDDVGAAPAQNISFDHGSEQPS
jgi:hypothetical protein